MIDRGEASGVEGRPQMIVLHGPNLNMLGRRSAEHYGRLTLEKIHLSVTAEAGLFEWEAVCHQTNCEGEFIELVQQYLDGDAFLVNPGAWTHYSLSLIHISEPTRLRRISYAVFCLKKKKNQKDDPIRQCLSITQ